MGGPSLRIDRRLSKAIDSDMEPVPLSLPNYQGPYGVVRE